MTDENQQMNPDDADLELVRQLRRKIVNDLTAKGLPDGPEDRDFLLKAADGLAKTALGKKKLNVDAGLATSNAEIAATLAKAFNDIRLQTAFVADGGGSIPTLPDEFKQPSVVPGELTDVGTDITGYRSFMQKFNGDESQ